MRKRIGQIARGKFEYAKPILTFSEEIIDFSVAKDTDETGEFVITSSDHIKIRGIVYSTNPRMECLTPNFEGGEVRIRYQFHSKGLDVGETAKGTFVIVCNNAQYSLSFNVKITLHHTEASTGAIRNLDDFTMLAKEHLNESYKLFYSKDFKNIIADRQMRERMLYNGYMKAKPSLQNLEEFLIGINKKQPVELSVSRTEAEYNDITDDIRDSFEIIKSNWGYVEISIDTDAHFIKLPKKVVSLDDFIGSTFRYDYIISKADMHAGKNYGRIYIRSVYQTYQIDVTAECVPADKALYKEKRKLSSDIKKCRADITKLYEAYRLKKIVTGVWANETTGILDHLRALCPDEKIYVLLKAQVLIANRQRQDAEWILDEFKKTWTDKKSPLWGYYLYLMTLMDREPAYIDRTAREIELIFRENPDSDILFWILLFLKEQYYNNSFHKLKAIENWVGSGCVSPYIYIEAYYLICREPYLLTQLGKFEIGLLGWAMKNNAIGNEIAQQIFDIAEPGRTFDKRIYDLLCFCYEIVPEDENLGIICGYLIKGQQYDPAYHIWFEKGIEKKLRITGLYEAFLCSMDDRKISAIPKIIQMYFQYDSKMSYRKLAVLYNNIIAAKNTDGEIYHKYRKTIGKFAMEQVEQGHMDDNLAVVYEDMLELGFINRELAQALSKILFTNKLIVFDTKIVRAIIYQNQLAEPQIVSVNDKTAYFQLYSDDYVILFEDEKGYRYSKSTSFQLQQLMNIPRYIEKCMNLAPDAIEYSIYFYAKLHGKENTSGNAGKFFKNIILSSIVSDHYKALLIPEMIKSCDENDVFIDEIIEKTDFEQLACKDRNIILNIIVKRRSYDMAKELTAVYGVDRLTADAKVAMASYLIKNTSEKDDFVITLSLEAFLAQKYDTAILEYLCLYYNGPTTIMLDIWRAAKKFELGTFDIEEKIIDQQIYAGQDLNAIYDVFMSYYKNAGRQMSVLAYITAVAHSYFRDDIKVKSDIFMIIEHRYEQELLLNDICLLALLKFYSEASQITGYEKKIEDELLAKYTCKNMVFGFYGKLDHELIRKYHLYDKVFLEYKGKPKSHVVLHYSRDEDGNNFITEDMTEVYDGIYVKTFVMFFGEMIKYYVSEESGNKVEVTEGKRITNNNVYGEEDESRYNLINQMIISHTLQDDNTMYENMKEYNTFDIVTKNVFKLL